MLERISPFFSNIDHCFIGEFFAPGLTDWLWPGHLLSSSASAHKWHRGFCLLEPTHQTPGLFDGSALTSTVMISGASDTEVVNSSLGSSGLHLFLLEVETRRLMKSPVWWIQLTEIDEKKYPPVRSPIAVRAKRTYSLIFSMISSIKKPPHFFLFVKIKNARKTLSFLLIYTDVVWIPYKAC